MKLALFGYGGHAREVAAQIGKDITFYVDDQYVPDIPNVKGISLFNPNDELMMIAIGLSEERERIVKRLPKETQYFSFIHPTAQVMDEGIEIGEGSFIGANCILTTDIKLGKHTLLNRGNHVAHDCNIGDYFSMMPGSILSGNVTIGDGVYLGTNSTVIQQLNICSKVIIGAGAVVVKEINESGTYVGIPAKKIK